MPRETILPQGILRKRTSDKNPGTLESLRSQTLWLEGIVLEFHEPKPTTETTRALRICKEFGF